MPTCSFHASKGLIGLTAKEVEVKWGVKVEPESFGGCMKTIKDKDTPIEYHDYICVIGDGDTICDILRNKDPPTTPNLLDLLPHKQREVLGKMVIGKTYTLPEIGYRLASVKALEKKGYVKITYPYETNNGVTTLLVERLK